MKELGGQDAANGAGHHGFNPINPPLNVNSQQYHEHTPIAGSSGTSESYHGTISGTMDDSYSQSDTDIYKMESVTSINMDKNKTTYMQSVMHLVKANMGAGILGMPAAFANSGLYLGAILVPIIAFLAGYAIHVLILASERLTDVFGIHALDYEKIAEEAMNNGPSPFRRFSRLFGGIVQGFIVACQYCICTIFALYIAKNLQQILETYTNIDLSVEIYLLVIFFLMCPLNCLDNMKKLAVLSAGGNLLQATGLVIICTDLFQGLPPIANRTGFVEDITKVPLMVSSTIYAFEGIAVVTPVYKAMRTQEHFLSRLGVVNVSYILLFISYTVIGFMGYWKYGSDTLVAGTITLNLPKEPLYVCVRIFFIVSLFISYPLQMYVVREMVEPWIERRFPSRARYYKYTAIFMLVAITFISAGVIPKLDLLLSLAGAVTSTTVAIIVPPIIHLLLFWETTHGSDRLWLAVRNLLVTGVGILGFILGAYFSVVEIVNSFQPQPWSNVTTNGTFLREELWHPES